MRVRAGGIVTTVVVALVAVAPAASAHDGTAAVEETVQAVAPQLDVVVPERTDADAWRARSREVDVTVAPQGGGEVTLESANSVPVLLQLPEIGATEVSAAEGGTLVLHGRGDVDVAVQAAEDGARVQTVLHSSSAPDEYRYSFQGLVPVLQGDGSVSIRLDAHTATEVARIAAPWAKDANGYDVPTRYRVEGATVVQEVDHIAAAPAYPVVADPRLTYGWGIYINAYGWEWMSLAAAVAALSGGAAVVSCVALNIPNPWAAVLKSACGTIGASNLNNFVKWVAEAYNGTGLDGTACYQSNFVIRQKLTKVAAAGNCRA